MKNMLWMAVTPDRYELPIAVEESAALLAIRMGTSRSNIMCRRLRKGSGKLNGYKVVAVED